MSVHRGPAPVRRLSPVTRERKVVPMKFLNVAKSKKKTKGKGAGKK